MSVRVRPCSERERRSSSGRVTTIAPDSSRDTWIGAGTVCWSVPLGPLTVTESPSMVTSTPAGTGTGILPMRDIAGLPSPSRLPDVGEDFPAHALGGCLLVGQETGRRGDDRHAEAAEDPRQVGGLRVHAQARLGHAADAGERALAVGAELQLDREVLAHRGVLDGPARDVALVLEDLRDVGLELGVRH